MDQDKHLLTLNQDCWVTMDQDKDWVQMGTGWSGTNLCTLVWAWTGGETTMLNPNPAFWSLEWIFMVARESKTGFKRTKSKRKSIFSNCESVASSKIFLKCNWKLPTSTGCLQSSAWRVSSVYKYMECAHVHVCTYACVHIRACKNYLFELGTVGILTNDSMSLKMRCRKSTAMYLTQGCPRRNSGKSSNFPVFLSSIWLGAGGWIKI